MKMDKKKVIKDIVLIVIFELVVLWAIVSFEDFMRGI